MPSSPELLVCDAAALIEGFERDPVRFRHALASSPALDLDALRVIAPRLATVEVLRGDMNASAPVWGVGAPAAGADALLRDMVAAGSSWVLLGDVDGSPSQGRWLRSVIEALRVSLGQRLESGRAGRACVWIGSPGARLPAHIGLSHQLWLQVAGDVRVDVYEAGSGRGAWLGSEGSVPRARAGALPVSLPPGAPGRSWTLRPGDGLHVPTLHPRAIQVARGVAVCVLVTFSSRCLERRRAAMRIEQRLRGWGAALPPGKGSRMGRGLTTLAAAGLGALRGLCGPRLAPAPPLRSATGHGVRPTFLIVGASRCGTTSLHAWLGQHPEVFVSHVKEPTYFVHRYCHSGLDLYLDLFRDGVGRAAVGEASTAYLVAPESAALIHDALGPVRIVVLLRDPVERAYSMYQRMAMLGMEWVPSFEEALDAEGKRFVDASFRLHHPTLFWDLMYLRGGLYCEQVARYIDVFGRRSVGVFLFDHLRSRPRQLFDEVCDFIGVAPGRPVDFSPLNAGRLPRATRLQALLREVEQSHWVRRSQGAHGAVQRAMRANLRPGRPGPMAPQVQAMLCDAYRDEVARLGEMLGRDLSHWARHQPS